MKTLRSKAFYKEALSLMPGGVNSPVRAFRAVGGSPLFINSAKGSKIYDVDGNEYHLWDSMNEYRPRVMVIEFNPTIPNEVVFIQPRDMKVFQGSSLKAFVELGKRKGYELIATNETNAFFLLKELFPKFGIADNSIDALHTDHRFETKLFQLYDGTLKIAGNTKLLWHNLPIDEEKLQTLSIHKRKYPARISESGVIRMLKYWARTLPFYPLVQKARKALARR